MKNNAAIRMSTTPIIELFVTGFGPFLNVTENPSATIMKLVSAHFSNPQQQQKQHPASYSVKVAFADELEVSVQAVGAYVDALAAKLNKSDITNSAAHHRLFVHFGVNRAAKQTIAVETQAVNVINLPPNDLSGFKGEVLAPIVPDPRATHIAAKKSDSRKGDGGDDDLDKAEHNKKAEFTADTTGDDAAAANNNNAAVKTDIQPPPPPLSSTARLAFTALVTSLSDKVAQICAKMAPFPPSADQNDDVDDKTAPPLVSLKPSTYAGAYLCNFIFFRSLLNLSRNFAVTAKETARDGGGEEAYVRWATSKPLNEDADREKRLFAAAAAVDAPPQSLSHSLFIHVMDPERCSVTVQAKQCCALLEQLMEKIVAAA